MKAKAKAKKKAKKKSLVTRSKKKKAKKSAALPRTVQRSSEKAQHVDLTAEDFEGEIIETAIITSEPVRLEGDAEFLFTNNHDELNNLENFEALVRAVLPLTEEYHKKVSLLGRAFGVKLSERVIFSIDTGTDSPAP